jgi:Fic family protein
VLIAALVIDFLAIHPVADGNGRVARLVTTHELLSHGYGVARYVSIEQRILESKHTYYDRLYRSQLGWHEGEHDIWPWASYLAQVVAGAYDDFERRVAAAAEQTGTKQQRVREYILTQAPAEFRRRDIERALPEVSPATIRLVINELRDRKEIVAIGGGPSARWRRE